MERDELHAEYNRWLVIHTNAYDRIGKLVQPLGDTEVPMDKILMMHKEIEKLQEQMDEANEKMKDIRLKLADQTKSA